MALMQVEWITCPACGSIFRVTVPTRTTHIEIYSSYGYDEDSNQNYFERDAPYGHLPIGDDTTLEYGNQKLVMDTQWSYIKTTCPKPGCHQEMFVVCIFV
jgi:hypothetical protein